MTNVGKMLVIALTALAILFLGISTVAFTTASDWKAAVAARRQTVTDLTQQNNDATARIEALKKDLAKAQADHTAASRGLEAKIGQLAADIEKIQKETEATRVEVAAAQEKAKAALDVAEARRKDTDDLREQRRAVDAVAAEFKARQAELNDQIRLLTRERDVARKHADDLRARAGATRRGPST